LPASHLAVEITESVLVEDSTNAVLVLRALRELGIRVHIDDFGTGYSSLSYLTRLPLDSLKIDRSFVSRLGEEREADVVVSAVIGMASALGLHVIAEGVETRQQAVILGGLGCGALQGYLIARPLPPADVPAALALLESAGVAYGSPSGTMPL
jgi:EAL domain-containing protein (putative c-di-GMP-specific phosphodiesterase class I)